jgi:squalene-associated FAD-dependent desaturase
MRWPELGWFDRLRIAWGLHRLMRLKLTSEHDDVLAVEWLRSAGQSQKAIHSFWSTILVSALGEQIERVTLPATRKVLIDGFAANRSAYHLLVPNGRLSELIGDKAEMVLADLGIPVRLSSPVKGLRWQAHGCPSVELVDGLTIDAEHVVVAVPWYQFRRILSEDQPATPKAILDWLKQSKGLESAPITGVHTWWDQPWLEPPHAILIDRLCQWVFRHSEDQHEARGEYYYQVVISGSRNLPRGDQQACLDAVAKDLQSVFPKAAQSRMLRGKIVTDPNSVFSVAKGHQSARPPVDLFATHNLWICGDWTATGWPATMEGAIRSGFTATESIARHNGRPRSWVAADLPRSWLSKLLIRR